MIPRIPLTQHKYEAVILLHCHIPSVNSGTGIGKRRNGTLYQFRSPHAKQFKEEVASELRKTNFIELASLDIKFSELDLEFFLTHEFWARDASNMFKFTEDAIHAVIRAPDSRNIRIGATKRESETDQESIRIVYTCYVA